MTSGFEELFQGNIKAAVRVNVALPFLLIFIFSCWFDNPMVRRFSYILLLLSLMWQFVSVNMVLLDI